MLRQERYGLGRGGGLKFGASHLLASFAVLAEMLLNN